MPGSEAHAILPIYAGTPPKDDIPKALAAAHKAVELDDSLAEAHTCLANSLVMNVQLPQSEPEFRRAIELNPNYATAHQWFGECLFGEGRFTEAIAELQRAHELDPLSLIINASYGMALGGAGQTKEAIEQLRKTLELDPSFVPAHSMLGQILENAGKIDEATAEYEKVRQLNPMPSSLAMLAHVYAKADKKAEARKILEDMTNLSHQRYVAAYPLAIAHLALGEKEEALRLLEKSFDERCILLQGLFGSLAVDNRLDPRFQKLLARFLSGNL